MQYFFSVRVLLTLLNTRAISWLIVIASLKQRRRRRQRERQKKVTGLAQQNNNFIPASCFFVHFFKSLPSLHDYDVKMPNFTWRTNTRQRLSLSFPELRCSLAVTAKKCTKKRDAGAELLFCQPRPIAVLVDGAVVVAYEHKRKQILCSNWLPQLTRWAYSPPPHTHSRDYRQTKIWFYRDRGKLDQESWSPMLGIFST